VESSPSHDHLFNKPKRQKTGVGLGETFQNRIKRGGATKKRRKNGARLGPKGKAKTTSLANERELQAMEGEGKVWVIVASQGNGTKPRSAPSERDVTAQ